MIYAVCTVTFGVGPAIIHMDGGRVLTKEILDIAQTQAFTPAPASSFLWEVEFSFTCSEEEPDCG